MRLSSLSEIHPSFSFLALVFLFRFSFPGVKINLLRFVFETCLYGGQSMVDKQYIRINVSVGKSFSYLEYHTDSIIKASSTDIYYTEYSLIRKIEIDNQFDEDYENLLVHMEFSNEIFSSADFCTGKIPARKKTIVKVDPKIRVDEKSLYRQNGVSTSTIFISLRNPKDNAELSSLTKTIKVLPLTQASDEVSKTPLLFAKYCITSFPQLVRLQLAANKEKSLLSGVEHSDIVGYQNSSVNDIVNEVSCIYRAVHNSCDITYSNPPNSSEAVQNVRLPDTVLKTTLGTCLDLAILFSSCLLQVGLHPILVLTDGHAFCGCFLHEYDSFSGLLETKPNVVYSEAVGEQKSLILFECTTATNSFSVPFSEAMKIGQENLRAYRGSFAAIDVYRSQQSVFKPIPIPDDQGIVDFKVPFVKLNPEELEDINEYQGTPIPESDTNDRFATWEKKLLDLSNSNKLVNFRFSRDKSNYSLVIPPNGKGKEVYEFLKEKDGSFSLLPFLSSTMDKMAFDAAESKRKENTLLSTADCKVMKNLIRKDNESREETGSPTLYLSIGLLKGSDTSGKYTREIMAPFLLLPVKITKDRYGEKFKVTYDIEEMMVNKTFFEYYKMKKGTDYDNLYSVSSHNDFDDILATLRSNHSGDIQVDENVCFFANFLFTHMVMWQDIVDRQDVLKKNVIIHSLLENRSFVNDEPLTVDNADELDHMIDFAAPLPYDSTQLRAIRECAKGNSFILDGPPGTGKSQTIVNMIVNAFYHGKTVLFVAEKQAALEVVRQRLATLGLDQFALQLYSSKTNKQAFFSQLQKAMDYGKKSSEEDFGKTCEDIEEDKRYINDELRRLHSHKKHFYSLYEAITKELATNDIKNTMVFSPEFLSSYNSEINQRVRNDLHHIVKTMKEFDKSEEEVYLSSIQFRHYTYQDQTKTSAIFSRLLSSLNRLKEKYGYFISQLNVEFTPTFNNIQYVAELLSILRENEVRIDCFAKADASSYLKDVKESMLQIESFARLENSLLGQYDVTKIPLVDGKKARTAYSKGTNIFNRKKARKNALEILSPMLIQNKDTMEEEDILKAIDAAEEYNELRNNAMRYKFVLSDFFQSSVLDDLKNFEAYQRILGNTQKLYDALYHNDMRLFDRIYTVLTGINPIQKAGLYREYDSFRAELDSFNQELEQIVKEYPMDFSSMKNMDFFKSYEGLFRLFADDEGQYKIDQYTKLLKDFDDLNSLGLQDFVLSIQKGEIPVLEIERTFEHILCHSFVVTSFVMDDENNDFDSKSYEEKIKDYQDLIRRYNSLCIGETIERITDKFQDPELKRSSTTPVGALRKIVMNSGKGISIRNVLFRFEDLIRMYFPCFLMSPLAAAQYLDVNSKKFDIVIFDEASQIPTSEAVGPIARGNSLIVAGDPQQMPPSNYFAVGMKSDDETQDDMALYQDAESLLDDCIAIDMPRIRLAFHYRSKHESLIQFSNMNFYGGDLFTFPSRDNLASHISFVHVNGDGKKKGSDISSEEVQTILHILSDILDNPKTQKKSIGIIVFNSNQQEKLEEEVDAFLNRNQNYLALTHWNEEDSTKKLFVKNLENVQGDERDIIIMSVGFAKGNDGKALINGPLSLPKGERRLNVAASRSIEQMIVVSTIYASDIDETGRKNLGAKNLKDFLLFSQNCKEFAFNASNDSPNKDLAYFISKELKDKGYDCDVAVGSSEFKVDLAVRKKGQNDYLLGILLDEKPLNPNVSCRDRFYVEPVILKNLGWRIVRVYTVSFLRYRQRTIKKLIEMVESIQDESQTEETLYVPPVLTEHHVTSQDYGIVPYEPYEFVPDSPLVGDLDPEEYYSGLSQFLSELIKKEYPISEDRILELSKKKMGLSRLSQRNVQTILAHIRMLKPVETKDLEDKTFYWPNGCELAVKNFRSSDRDILDISKEEFLPLINNIIRIYKDIDKEELIRVLALQMSITSINSKVRRKLEYVIHTLKEEGKLETGYHELSGYLMNS